MDAYRRKHALANGIVTIYDTIESVPNNSDNIFITNPIDSEEDFQMMQYLYGYYCGIDAGMKEVHTIAKIIVVEY